MMIHILACLPPEYAITVALTENKLDDDTDPLKLDQLCEMINNKYQRLMSCEPIENNRGTIFFTQGPRQSTRGFKGLCYRCGHFGHKGIKCPENQGNGQQGG